jgi:hypothetical protein
LRAYVSYRGAFRELEAPATLIAHADEVIE